MKWLLTSIALAAPAVALAQADVTYDRFKDVTSIVSKKSTPKLDRINIEWAASFKGQTLNSRPPALLVLLTMSERWRYLKCHDVTILADGRRVPISVETAHRGDVGYGGVMEWVSVIVPNPSVDLMAAADTLEIQLCQTEQRFDGGDRIVIRDFVEATTPKR